MTDRNAERPQFIGQFSVLIDGKSDVLGDFDVFEALARRRDLVTKKARHSPGLLLETLDNRSCQFPVRAFAILPR